jgi:hypothetical protein
MQIKRRNMLWVGTLAILTGIAAFSPGVDPAVTLVLLGGLGVVAAVALMDLRPVQVIKSVQQRANIGTGVSADAHEATERARARGVYRSSDIRLLDVGLIALRERADGLVMQRTRSLSLDDNSLRPYLTMQVPALEADRRAEVRFVIEDGHGKKVYVHEQEVYLRDGRLDVLASNQMPLFDSTMNLEPGDGDLRVYVNDELMAVLGFTLAPSTRDRWAGRRTERSERSTSRLQDDTPPPAAAANDDAPVSLEDLLRSQNGHEQS